MGWDGGVRFAVTTSRRLARRVGPACRLSASGSPRSVVKLDGQQGSGRDVLQGIDLVDVIFGNIRLSSGDRAGDERRRSFVKLALVSASMCRRALGS